MQRPLREKLLWLLLLLSVAGSFLPSFRDEYWRGPNLYAQQARQFLHGKLGLDQQHYDTVAFGGQYFVVNPPFPSIVLLPLVAITPETWDRSISTFLCFVLTAIGWWALNRVLATLNVPYLLRRWSCIGLFAGTGYWFCLQACYGMWFFAHIVAITALLLAVYFAVCQPNGWLTGVCFGAALLSRQMMVYSGVFLIVTLWQQRKQQRAMHIAGFLVMTFLAAAGYLWFNWARFGDPLQTGYSLLTQTDFLDWRQQHIGMFSPVYIPVNLVHLLVQGFHVEFDAPGYMTRWRMNPFGTSLTFGSPFVFLAFWGKLPLGSGATRSLWVSIVLTVLHVLMYHTTGWVQVNTYRYALDFIPLLLLLATCGAAEGFA